MQSLRYFENESGEGIVESEHVQGERVRFPGKTAKNMHGGRSRSALRISVLLWDYAARALRRNGIDDRALLCGRVSAFDYCGLLIGNLLAVLSWCFLTAPIAVKTRLTLYYQLERICGRKLVILYNLANGIMFCFLAGAMITVSATAIGMWFHIPMPALDAMLPNSFSWCLATLIIGGVIAFVAAAGYQTVSKISNLAAPWMVLCFSHSVLWHSRILNVSEFRIKAAGFSLGFANTVL